LINTKNNKVLDVSGGSDRNGQNVILWKKHNGANQKWVIIYLDTIKKTVAVKGVKTRTIRRRGIIANRPFNLVSKMPGNRLLTLNGNNL